MRQQKKISIYLKGITGVLVAAIVGLTAYLSVTAVRIKSQGIGSPWQYIIWTYVYAICCLVILYQFYRICCRIGMDESFSMGNAKSFTSMERASYVAGMAAFIRIFWCMYTPAVITADIRPQLDENFIARAVDIRLVLLLSIFEFFIFIIFGLLCRALSALVANAAAIKQENELTI
ncbi:MAG: DUF2975 domain-containing protein [Pseudobutyrivibrio sp.]|nr:DUF2975 domain-containing protein [Pseudobutyrivibrio sp.]